MERIYVLCVKNVNNRDRIDNLSKEAADKIAAEINVCGGEAFVEKN